MQATCLPKLFQNSETRVMVSVLKQDPNTQQVKKKSYLLGQNTTCKFQGNPLYQATK